MLSSRQGASSHPISASPTLYQIYLSLGREQALGQGQLQDLSGVLPGQCCQPHGYREREWHRVY